MLKHGYECAFASGLQESRKERGINISILDVYTIDVCYILLSKQQHRVCKYGLHMTRTSILS